MTDRPWYGGRWREVRQAVLDRDGYVCQLCFEPIDRHARPTDPRAPHVDHVVQPERGGAWWELSNLRAAHRRCNIVRANVGRGQAPTPRRYAPRRTW